ncbi:hypothetical protein B9Z55_021077 [Caenorhabditis nigoni]|nr:hypothetical protein B9Z55_021077 [Caenorhabditis nigoni]
MNEAIVKDEVIEETHNLTFKNGEYVEVKQEEIEQKPEYVLEKEIKVEPIDIYENKPDNFFADSELKPKESGPIMRNVFTAVGAQSCEICWKSMPRNLLKLITMKDDKTVLFQFFKFEGSLETSTPYVCYSHIQKIIDDNEGKFKIPTNRFERLMRSFITKNKHLIKYRTSNRRICQVCRMSKDRSELYETFSKGIRIVLMVGCILRGTHSIEQAMSYITNNSGFTCDSHCKESIGMIFENLGVSNIQEFFECPKFAMSDLMDIVKNFDSNFTVEQFIHAFNALFRKRPKVSH